MTNSDINVISSKIDSLHAKILKSKFAEVVTESEMMSLILAVGELNRQKAEIERLNIVKKEYQELYDELKTENKRLETSIKEANEYLSEGDFANGISIIIRLVKDMND